MTTPRYPTGCAEGSKAHGRTSAGPVAWSPASDVWVVNFNNGNSNDYHRNNRAFVRAVRASRECQGDGYAVSFRALYDAWRDARRGKQSSANQLAFDSDWISNLLELQRQLAAGTWSPRPSTCFIAARPKAREIHAPDFSDRVVHHWLVPQLEEIYEHTFIHDSYANRTGKGTHAAVRRLRDFVHEVHSGQGGGWYLQLDIHNFFNSIHRGTLWRILRTRMRRRNLPWHAQRAAHALLRRAPGAAGVRYLATAQQRAMVPPHKRLENAPAGCGLPIGNLSSQFLANVYLDRLDQFVKHELKAKRYLRYVDDFVLVHHSREQLADWQPRIERFLADELRLRLKADIRLRPLRDGIDFLGYQVYPTRTHVRARVIRHAREAISAWESRHVRRRHIRATPADLRSIACTWSSYLGHFRHADSRGLLEQLRHRFRWLDSAIDRRRRFHHSLERRRLTLPLEHHR
jgi:RNA-directed DNA polymerase